MKNKTVRIYGVIAQAGKVSANGLTYSQECLENAVTSFQKNNSPTLAYVENTDTNSFAHLMGMCSRLDLKDTNLTATVRCLTTPMAERVKGWIESGKGVSITMRGSATLSEDKVTIIGLDIDSFGISPT